MNPENPLYLVHFQQGSVSLAQLSNQHHIIDGLSIRWEKMNNKKRRLTHCSNCQRWGHSSALCGRPFRCVKCIIPHAKGECNRKVKPSDTVKPGLPACINCLDEGHPANSTKCKEYQKYRDFVDARRHQNPIPKARRFDSTPAPWLHNNLQMTSRSAITEYQSKASEYPPLSFNEPSAKRSSQVPVNVRQQDINRHNIVKSSLNPHANDFTLPFIDLQSELNSIPNLKSILSNVLNVIRDMKHAKSQKDAERILFQFLTGLCI